MHACVCVYSPLHDHSVDGDGDTVDDDKGEQREESTDDESTVDVRRVCGFDRGVAAICCPSSVGCGSDSRALCALT